MSESEVKKNKKKSGTTNWKSFFENQLGKSKKNGEFPKLAILLFFLFMAMIFISHYAEGKKIELGKLKAQVEEMQWQHKTQKAEFMNLTKQSELVDRVKSAGMEELTEPVKVITYQADELGFEEEKK